MPTFREHTRDAEIWESVYSRNEYGVTTRFSADDLIIDIGANVGAFTCLVHDLGARDIIAIEADAETFIYLTQNAPIDVSCRRKAVWHQTRGVFVVCANPDDPLNAGGFAVNREDWHERCEVETVVFDELLQGRDPPRLLKLDCEGAEWPIIQTSQRIGECQCIIGEYHTLPRTSFDDLLPIFHDEYDQSWLRHLLEVKLHYNVLIQPPTANGTGHFRAWRHGKEVWAT